MAKRPKPRFVYDLSTFATQYPKPYVFVELSNPDAPGKRLALPAVVDSGADFTCFPRNIAEALGHEFEKGEHWPTIGIGAQTMSYRHKITVRLVAPGADPRHLTDADILPWRWEVPAVICDKLPVGLLGCHDSLKDWELRLRVQAATFTLIATEPKLQVAIRSWRQKHRKRTT